MDGATAKFASAGKKNAEQTQYPYLLRRFSPIA